MTYDDCIKSGKLKKSKIEGDVVSRTMKMAEDDLESSKGSIDNEDFIWSTVQSYSCMLNCARSILFNDGFVENSHYCVVEYLRYLYIDELEDHIERMDILRKERHRILYNSRDTINKTSAEIRIRWAREFLDETKRILGSNNES